MRGDLPHDFIIGYKFLGVNYFLFVILKVLWYCVYMYSRFTYLRTKLKGLPFVIRKKWMFATPELYEGYLQACRAYKRYLRKAPRPKNKFYEVPKLRIFSNYGFRALPLIETKYYLLGEAGKIPIDTIKSKISLDDFVVHLHLLGNTFNRSGRQLLNDLTSVSDEEYFRVLDSIFYKDIFVTYLYKVRKRLLTYLDKHQVYTVSRQSHKLMNKVDNLSDRYFTKQEREIINSPKEICLVRDRVQYYRRYRG